MENLYDRLIQQLDALVPFIALAHKNVFHLIQSDHEVWFRAQDENTLPSTYKIYQKQITHGSFLLGYGYSEAFLTDLLRLIYLYNPRMLPEEKQLKFSEIRSVKSYKAVLKLMIEKEVYSVATQSMADISDYFKKKFSMEWSKSLREKAILASLIRNCIIHNSEVADSRLAKISKNKYIEGTEIFLEPSDVHSYGITIRKLARNLWDHANQAFLKKRKIYAY